MRRRRKVSRKGSRRLFSKTARKVHKRNFKSHLSRGGIRF